jgi:hypothetical protein
MNTVGTLMRATAALAPASPQATVAEGAKPTLPPLPVGEEALREQVRLLESQLQAEEERHVAAAARQEAQLRALAAETTAKLGEFERLRGLLLADLRQRCEKVPQGCVSSLIGGQIVDLEMLLEEAREEYEELLKNASWKAGQKKVRDLRPADPPYRERSCKRWRRV